MTVPLISIDRHHSDAYEWFLTWGVKLHHSNFGHADIASCLQSAVSVAPPEHGIVEIMYRHIHMGTHLIEDIANDAGRLAKQISDRYAKLTGVPVRTIG